MDLEGLELADTTWMDGAACRRLADPDAFFAASGDELEEARQVCAGCPVREACLAWAVDREWVEGIWGGTTFVQRRQLRRSRL